MEDRELLELAAKAAGHQLYELASAHIAQGVGPDDWLIINDRGGHSVWNPLTNDGDALRLAVKLGLDIMTRRAHGGAYAGTPEHGASTSAEDEPYAATRRAIVRAAAEIGKAAP